jgi:hypothetical protein
VRLENREKPKERAERMEKMANESFTTNSVEVIAPPAPVAKKDKDASKYM